MYRLILTAALCCIGAPVYAHDWFPLACCSAQDCYRVPASEIEATPGGWRIAATGEVIPYDRTRQTPPEGGGEFFRCSFKGNPEARTIGKTYPRACFWAPSVGG